MSALRCDLTEQTEWKKTCGQLEERLKQMEEDSNMVSHWLCFCHQVAIWGDHCLVYTCLEMTDVGSIQLYFMAWLVSLLLLWHYLLHLHTSHISNRALLSFPMLQIYKNDSVISSHILNRVLLSFPMLLQKNQSLEILFACFSDEALCESTWLLEKSVVRVRIEHRPNSTWTPVNYWATRFHSTLPCVSSTRGSELFTYIKIKSPRPCRKNKKTRLFCYLYN